MEQIFANLTFLKDFAELIFAKLMPKNLRELIPRIFDPAKINPYKIKEEEDLYFYLKATKKASFSFIGM